ncbi:MAG: MarR family transcriptional regulator [Parcubacteria group bacterium]|jgi:DNA-binding MarR family transcriptional regulator
MQTITESIMCIASRLERIADQHIFRHIDLSAISVKILFIIHIHPSITPSDIQESVGGTKSNISQRLNYLEKKGFITRTHTKDADKRTVSLTLTPIGKKKITTIKKWLTKANLHLEKHFTQKELHTHFDFLKKLHTVLDHEEKNHSHKLYTCKKI